MTCSLPSKETKWLLCWRFSRARGVPRPFQPEWQMPFLITIKRECRTIKFLRSMFLIALSVRAGDVGKLKNFLEHELCCDQPVGARMCQPVETGIIFR